MAGNNKSLKDYKLSLKFNELDPTQAEAIKILKQMGHKKSLFISQAVLYYINNNSEALAPFKEARNLDKTIIESWFKEFIRKIQIAALPIENISSEESFSDISDNSPKPNKSIETEEPIISEEKIVEEAPPIKEEIPSSPSVSKESHILNNEENVDISEVLNMDEDDLADLLSGLDMFN